MPRTLNNTVLPGETEMHDKYCGHTTFSRIPGAWDANVPAFQTPGKGGELFATLDDDRNGVSDYVSVNFSKCFSKLSKFGS